MNIKAVEEKTGLTRANIRFYEKENLIAPHRHAGNGYRNFSEEDVRELQKIAYLRTLGISLEDIRLLKHHEVSLHDVVKKQKKVLEKQSQELAWAAVLCERMLAAPDRADYDHLDIERYLSEADGPVMDRRRLAGDSLGLFRLWGGLITWSAISLFCLLAAAAALPSLPDRIPVQWSGGVPVSYVNRFAILACPAVCVLFRFCLRPAIGQRVAQHLASDEVLTDFLVNGLCLLTAVIEIFIIVNAYRTGSDVRVWLCVSAVIPAGLFLAAAGQWRHR